MAGDSGLGGAVGIPEGIPEPSEGAKTNLRTAMITGPGSQTHTRPEGGGISAEDAAGAHYRTAVLPVEEGQNREDAGTLDASTLANADAEERLESRQSELNNVDKSENKGGRWGGSCFCCRRRA